MNRQLLLLTLCQGLFLTNNVTFIAINGLVGLQLAPFGWMATLPVMGYVVGGALSAPLVARVQARQGRKRSFQMGLVVAALSAGLCAVAVGSGQFWMLVASTVVAGFYSANASLYRFACPELVPASYQEKIRHVPGVTAVAKGNWFGGVYIDEKNFFPNASENSCAKESSIPVPSRLK